MTSADATESERGDLKATTYEFFILAVSLLSILNLALAVVVPFESESWLLIFYVDSGLTIIFLIDFAYRLRTSPDRRHYLLRGGGLLDLLSCVPGLRVVRLFRIVRAVRIVRRLGGPRIFRELREEFASGALYLVVFVGLTVLEFVGLMQLRFEEDTPGANITTAGDALWWGYVTATTVGYGDQFPVTTGGRIAGLVMLTVGVALFATFSGFLANAFLSPKTKSEPAAGSATVSELRALLEEQERATARLRARLDELDAAT